MTRNRLRPRGFNFTEVLFAVMILALGFIMVAAIFPVALLQSKQTQEETTAASVARGAANLLEQIGTNAVMPATGGDVRAIDTNQTVRGAMFLSSDPRYAWVPFYRRAGTPAPGTAPQPDWSSSAQVYMLPIAVRNRSVFDKGIPETVQRGSTNFPGNPAGSPPYAAFAVSGLSALVATITDATDPGNTTGVDIIEFTAGEGENDTDDNYTAVAEGSYVIIANVALPVGASERIGHIFRIGNPTEVQPAGSAYPRRWELAPGNDYVPRGVDTSTPPDGTIDVTPLSLDGADVFVVGRSLADPTALPSATNTREGRGQDVAAYTTFINIR